MCVHVCTGTNRRFIARCRRRGERKFTLVGPERMRQEAALRDLIRQWNRKPGYYIGDVIMVADYYEPVTVVELKSK